MLVLRVVWIDLTATWDRRKDAEARGSAVVGNDRLEALRRTAAANVRGFINMREVEWRDQQEMASTG